MICPKCKYERTLKDDVITPSYECPSCGVIYLKYKTEDEKELERLKIAEAHKTAIRTKNKQKNNETKNVSPSGIVSVIKKLEGTNKKKSDTDKDDVSGTTILIVLIVAVSIVIYASLNPTQRQVITVAPDYRVSAKQLYKEFEANEVAAFAKYNEKLVAVTGKNKGSGMSLGRPFIVMDVGSMFFSVQCMFDKSKAAQVGALQKGQIISLVGRVSGQTGNVFLNDCSLY